jgi:hypothetical protein
MMLDETDWALRRSIHGGSVANGAVPQHDELADVVGGSAGELVGDTDASVPLAVSALSS